jgi:hypothetical protein
MLADDIEKEFINDGKYEDEPNSWDKDDDGKRDMIEDATEEQRPVILKEINQLTKDLRDCSRRAKELEWYMGGDTGADSYLSRLNELGLLPKETYNKNELRHITVNYAISCLKGYNGSFEDWLKGISQNWREIANRK